MYQIRQRGKSFPPERAYLNTKKIAGVYNLGATGRGKSTEIGTYIESMITSELSGNLPDVCPVGALVNGVYIFLKFPNITVNK